MSEGPHPWAQIGLGLAMWGALCPSCLAGASQGWLWPEVLALQLGAAGSPSFSGDPAMLELLLRMEVGPAATWLYQCAVGWHGQRAVSSVGGPVYLPAPIKIRWAGWVLQQGGSRAPRASSCLILGKPAPVPGQSPPFIK